MSELKSAACLFHDAQHARERERLPCVEQRLKAFAFDQFHRDVKEAIFFTRVENHHNVRMSEQAGGASLRLETIEKFRTRQTGAFFRKTQCLYGYRAADHRINGLINNTHCAASELALDFVPSGFGQCDHNQNRKVRLHAATREKTPPRPIPDSTER